MKQPKFDQAIQLFDDYNQNDPEQTIVDGKKVPNNLLYARRMTKMLLDFLPDASEALRLAARSQHIGRWEIQRSEYPMDRKGYLIWRSRLKMHHADIASNIMEQSGYEASMISKVKDLLVKKQLKQNPETQTLEDVICLIFLQFYFDDFSKKHDDDKLISILKKTIAKMSGKGIEAALTLPLSRYTLKLLKKATEV